MARDIASRVGMPCRLLVLAFSLGACGGTSKQPADASVERPAIPEDAAAHGSGGGNSAVPVGDAGGSVSVGAPGMNRDGGQANDAGPAKDAPLPCDDKGSWTVQFGTALSEYGHAVAVDATGASYVMGATDERTGDAGTVDFTAFVTKYDAAGTKRWTQPIGTASIAENYGVATDRSGSVYVVGATATNLDDNTSAGGVDAFVAKYDADGSRQWAHQFGAADDDYGAAVAVDADAVYVVGSTRGTLGGGTVGGGGAFVAKFDGSGAQQWTRQFGSRDDQALGVAIDRAGAIYVTGSTKAGLDGNTFAGFWDVFLIKYDAEGTNLWTRQLGESGADMAYGVATDGEDGIYVTGTTDGSLDANPSLQGTDLFVVRYDADGTKQWTRQVDTTSGNLRGWAIATDRDGGVYAAGDVYYSTGYTGSGVDGNPPLGAPDAPDTSDAVLVKYDAMGAKQWLRVFGSAGNDISQGIAVDATGALHVTGNTYGNLDRYTNAGFADAFLVKQCGR